jgi:hypothetical protein
VSFREVNAKQPGDKGKKLVFPSENLSSTCDTSTAWRAPPSGTTMVNVDAGWDHLSKRAGIGERDSMGAVMFTEWRHVPYCASAEAAEAMACLARFKRLLKSPGSGVLATDCLRAANAINSVTFDRPPSWGIYMEIKDLLRYST